jgi:hypothetical protein
VNKSNHTETSGIESEATDTAYLTIEIGRIEVRPGEKYPYIVYDGEGEPRAYLTVKEFTDFYADYPGVVTA